MTYRYESKRKFPDLGVSTTVAINVDGVGSGEDGLEAIREPLWTMLRHVVDRHYCDWAADFYSVCTPTLISFPLMRRHVELWIHGEHRLPTLHEIVSRAAECAIADMTARTIECYYSDSLAAFGPSILVLRGGEHDPAT